MKKQGHLTNVIVRRNFMKQDSTLNDYIRHCLLDKMGIVWNDTSHDCG